MGAVLMSKVRLGNECSLDNLPDSDDDFIVQQLGGIFPEDQLRLMETAFEGCDISENDLGEKDIIKAKELYDLHGSDSDRLVAIMKNIIDNDGVFKP